VTSAVCGKVVITMVETYQIDFEPLGRRGTAYPGQTILAIAQSSGIGLASVCGGVGTCEECRIRLVSGTLTPPTLVEQEVLSVADFAQGVRLACQAEPLGNVKLDIPPDSLTTAQRLQVEGQESSFALHPVVTSPSAYGLAVDIGTTKLAAYLVRLSTGETIARAGAMNPQVAYGEDVISRIAFTTREKEGVFTLQKVLIDAINTLLAQLCSEANIDYRDVLDAVVVGNTIMHHLFAGLPVAQLGHSPFNPHTTSPLLIPASDLGLHLGPCANIYLPPVVAGYVGADHIAMLLATGACNSPKNSIALDIGTNTEIGLVANGKVTCCSCASGPAFEGAHIHEGMRAAPGAIERIRWSDDKFLCQTIDGLPPVGICGSGILDGIAALQDSHKIKSTGAFVTGMDPGIVIVPSAQTGLGRDLIITRKDVHEIQLAKSAIRSGVEVLLDDARLKYSDLDEFIVAGAFGTYLDLKSAVRTGMFPPVPKELFHQVGNAAGVGAKQMLLSVDKRHEAEQIANRIQYVELTGQASFTQLFLQHLRFEV
jgi:uncharacterized 2Fe-2S/4Fe-4S cluster protein (DUF4445 family)